MINLCITAELSQGVVKTYLGRYEAARTVEEFLKTVWDGNAKESSAFYFRVEKPASLMRMQNGQQAVIPEPVDDVWLPAVSIKSVSKMSPELARHYTNSISEVAVSAETGAAQQIVQ